MYLTGLGNCSWYTDTCGWENFYTFLNSLRTIGYLLEVFIELWGYLPWSVFSLLFGASTGNLSQSFIDTFSVGS